MVNALGRFLRKLRIDHGEFLKNMADKLGVSSAFLSAVENGKKNLPLTLKEKLIEVYQLDSQQQVAFNKAIENSVSEIRLDLAGRSDDERELAFAFARTFNEEHSKEELQKLFDLFTDLSSEGEN